MSGPAPQKAMTASTGPLIWFSASSVPGSESVVGRRPHSRQKALGLGQRRVHRRCLLEDGRRMASVTITAKRSHDRCARDGRVQSSPPRRAVSTAHAPQRPPSPIPRRLILTAARRQLDRRVGRLQGWVPPPPHASCSIGHPSSAKCSPDTNAKQTGRF